MFQCGCQRPSSITTRIKTVLAPKLIDFGCVRDHLPLQQGLRRLKKVLLRDSEVRDHLPLQQGLRLPFQYIAIRFSTVRDHLPLQQGLRPSAYL